MAEWQNSGGICRPGLIGRYAERRNRGTMVRAGLEEEYLGGRSVRASGVEHTTCRTRIRPCGVWASAYEGT